MVHPQKAPSARSSSTPVDNTFGYTPRRKLEALIDEWRRVSGYPIGVQPRSHQPPAASSPYD